MRASIIGLGFFLVGVVGWGDDHRPAWAESLDDLTSQMSKEQVSEVLTASWLYNLATINLLVTVADRADLLDHVDSLMNVALGIYGEGQIALSEEGEAMLDALRSIFDTAIEREQQGESP